MPIIGAIIIAEIVGYGATADAYHITAPAPQGEGAACNVKSHKDRITAKEIGYINAHGTSTYYNDLYETQAIKKYLEKRHIRFH